MASDLFVQIPYGVLKLSTLLAELPLDYANIAYNALQAGLNAFESRYPKLYFLMQKVKGVFIAIDFVALFWAVGKLAMVLDTKFNLLNGPESPLFALGSYGFICAWIAIGIGAVYAINKFMSWRRDAKKMLEVAMGEDDTQPPNIKIEIDFEKTNDQNFKQWMYVTRIVINVALACFVPGGGWFALSAALQTYSLISISQWKWMRFNIHYLATDKIADRVRNFTLRFYTLLFPASKQQEDDQCAVCLDSKPDIQFCPEHLLHEACAMRLIYSKVKEFLNQCILNIYEGSDKHGRYVDYHITLRNDIMPTCPTCRREPIFNKLTAEVDDKQCSRVRTEFSYVTKQDMYQLLEATI